MSTTAGANGLDLQTGRATEVTPPRPESLTPQTSSTAESIGASTSTAPPPPPTTNPEALSTMHPSVIVTSKEEQSAKVLIPASTENSSSSPRPLSPLSANIMSTTPTTSTLGTATTVAAPIKSNLGPVQKTGADPSPATSNISIPTDANDSNLPAPSSMSNQQQRSQTLNRRKANELIAQQVLDKSKILKASRRVRTRLQYAILKIRRGWSKYTLQEVESLLQPGRSPRVSARSPLKRDRDNVESSPRQSERHKAKGGNTNTNIYAYYHQPAYHNPYDNQDNNDDGEDEAPIQPPMRNSRTRMSLSQFTDSELYLPAKSLLSIATSRAEQDYASPYMQAHGSPFYSRPNTQHHGSPSLYHDPPASETKPQSSTSWSEYSASGTPQTSGSYMEVDEDEHGTPSEAQVARTILMLSSPTRPPPRTINQNYIVQMHSGSPTPAPITDWSGSYGPSASPLAHYQSTTASTTPVQSPILSQLPFSPSSDYIKAEQDQRQAMSNKPHRLPYIANLYGMAHGPSSPSPLSISTLPPPTDRDDEGSMSRSASPTLKRAVKFAAEHMESGDAHFQQYPPLSESSGHHYYSASSPPYPSAGETHPTTGDSFHHRALTPPPRSGGSYASSSAPGATHHGMRTPPPSSENNMAIDNYQQLPTVRQFSKGPITPDAMIQAERIRVKRRNSGLAGGSDVDLRNLYSTAGPAHHSPHGSQPHSPVVHQ